MRNSSLVEEFGVIILGHKLFTEAMDLVRDGEGSIPAALKVRDNLAGATGKANVGISNDKGSEKLPRRKTKVS